MKRFFVVLVVVAPLFLVACTSHVDKAAGGGPDGPRKVTASGYTKEGCLLNLKLMAHERNVRLVPDGVQVEPNALMFLSHSWIMKAIGVRGVSPNKTNAPRAKIRSTPSSNADSGFIFIRFAAVSDLACRRGDIRQTIDDDHCPVAKRIRDDRIVLSFPLFIHKKGESADIG